MSVDVNPKHTVATVTAFRRLLGPETPEKKILPRLVPVLNMVVINLDMEPLCKIILLVSICIIR